MNQSQRSNEDDGHGGGTSSTENRMATLLLLAKGREPSWSRLRFQQEQQKQKQQHSSRSKRSQGTSSSNSSPGSQKTLNLQFIFKIILCLWLFSSSIKVLLFPAYHSTDFDVHRHWKAVTLHLPIAEWYYDDKYVKTRHTLDYPPAFALMEHGLAVSMSTIHQLGALGTSSWQQQSAKGEKMTQSSPLSSTCLSLRDDVTVEADPTSSSCVAWMRWTVVLASDVVYWMGSFAVALTVAAGAAANTTPQQHFNAALVIFILLISHPAMLWLDHVHFQYNGMLLGVLFLSLAGLLHANNVSHSDNHRQDSNTATNSTRSLKQQHISHLAAAAAFSLLISLKHLYVTSSLWYGLYLFRRYCCSSISASKPSSRSASNNTRHAHQSILSSIKSAASFVFRFLLLATTTLLVAVVPLAIFAMAIGKEGSTTTKVFGIELNSALVAWFGQLWRRLFPFGRGLVHSYWAGNVWAIVLAAHKMTVFVVTRIAMRASDEDGKMLLSSVLQSVEVITPAVTALCMVLAQMPGLWLAWQAAAERSNAKLLRSFTMTSLATFLFQYHAHEKAIMTSLLPATLWACYTGLSGEGEDAWYIVGDFTAYSLLGLFPLLFQHQELALKVASTTAFLAIWYTLAPPSKSSQRRSPHAYQKKWVVVSLGIAALTAVQLEVLAPLGVFGRYEFFPLAVTSLVCAVAFVRCFIQLHRYRS